MGYMETNAAFYEEHADRWVLMKWNGIRPDNSGKQSCAFISARTEVLDRWRTASLFPDDALRFDTQEDAQAFLASENALRPHPLSEGWTALRLGDIEAYAGYRPLAKAAVTGGEAWGRDYEPDTTPAP